MTEFGQDPIESGAGIDPEMVALGAELDQVFAQAKEVITKVFAEQPGRTKPDKLFPEAVWEIHEGIYTDPTGKLFEVTCTRCIKPPEKISGMNGSTDIRFGIDNGQCSVQTNDTSAGTVALDEDRGLPQLVDRDEKGKITVVQREPVLPRVKDLLAQLQASTPTPLPPKR